MRVLYILAGIVWWSIPAFPQQKHAPDITLYIQNTYLDDSSDAMAIAIDYDLYYPVYTPVTIRVALLKKKTLFKIKVANNSLILDGKPLFVENGDTVFTTVSKKNKRVLFTDKNNQLLFYGSVKQSSNSRKKDYVYPSNKMNDSLFYYPTYRDYCRAYFAAERNFIDSFFGDKRRLIKERLVNTSRNNELICLLQPIVNGKPVEPAFKKEAASTIATEMKRLDHFQQGYILDPSYRFVLSQVNFFQAGISGNRLLAPAEYEQLYNTAIRTFSSDTYSYLLLGYLRSIARTGNESYKGIVDKINRQLKQGKQDALKHPVDSLYSNFQVLATNLSVFKEVEVKDPVGKKMLLGSLLEGEEPVLFDFWATWCAPCLVEIPYIDSVKKRFPNIKMISLSIDKDEGKWLRFVAKNEIMRESSYLLTTPDKSQIIRTYKIENVPRFILYNKRGECLSLDLTRPSENTFTETVQRLLK